MVTARGLRSTSRPCRARSYSFWPLILMAEYIGGICRMSPVNRGSAAATSGAVTATGCSSSTRPETSCVSVTRPSRSVATYSFSPLSAKETPRVACPTKTGSTPVAMGSSVPAWPTFFVFRMPRSLAHTSMDVQSAGLSMMMIPLAIGVSLRPFLAWKLLPNYAPVTFRYAARTAIRASSSVPFTVAPAAA